MNDEYKINVTYDKWIKDHEYLHGLFFIALQNVQKEVGNNFELMKKFDTRINSIEKSIIDLNKRIQLLQVCMVATILMLILLVLLMK